MARTRKNYLSDKEQIQESLLFNQDSFFMAKLRRKIAMHQQEPDQDEVKVGADKNGNVVIATNYLAHGMNGEIYKGVWKNNSIALKIIKVVPDCVWMAEAEVGVHYKLTQLGAPNIVRWYFSNTNRSNVYFVGMEYMNLGSLQDYMRCREKSWPLSINILKQCGQALDFLHKHEFLHNDIKSPNVFMKEVDTESEVVAKLGDFGYACTKDAAVKYHYRTGSPLWAAPELLAKESARNGEAQDIYSFGVLAYEVASWSGEAPFSHTNIRACEELIQYQKNTPEGKLLPIPEDSPAEVKELILKCIRKNPKERLKASQILPTLFGPAVPEVEMIDVEDNISEDEQIETMNCQFL